MAYKLIDYERLKAFSGGLKTKYATKNDIPKKLSDLQEDTTHRLVTDAEKTNWNNKVSQSQITEDVNARGSDKIWNVDFLQKQFGYFGIELNKKMDKSQITDDYYGQSQKNIVSQKGIRAMRLELRNDMNKKADQSSIPTKLSQLTNDKTFKTESEIQSMIEKASSLKKEVVASLPTTGEDDVIYLVKDKKGKDSNNYLEYLWLNGKYELIGSTQVDLSDYARMAYVDSYVQETTNPIRLALESTTNEVSKQLQSVVHKETDKAISGDQGTAITDNTKYTTPEYVNYLITLLATSRVEEYGEVTFKELEKKLDKTDIQEFTQQELEEAFKE